MEHYIVKGGNPLSGEVEIAGAKNAALGILAASVMTSETVTLENVPDVSDIRAILKAIRAIGGHVEKIDRHCYRINGSGITADAVVDNEYVRKIRGSYYLIGSLLSAGPAAKVCRRRKFRCHPRQKIGAGPVADHRSARLLHGMRQHPGCRRFSICSRDQDRLHAPGGHGQDIPAKTHGQSARKRRSAPSQTVQGRARQPAGGDSQRRPDRHPRTGRRQVLF